MSDAAILVSKALAAAVETTLNPLASQADRHIAYGFIEEFKEKSLLCSEVGVLLARTPGPPILRSFGLQLLEHCIRFRWNDISIEEKVYIKESSIVLLNIGTIHVLEEAIYVKEGIGRLLIEIAKREWPQQWATFLPEVLEGCLSPDRESKAEIALIILLRLSEDIGILQNVENPKRRRDLYLQFVNNLPQIFEFIDAVFTTYFGAVYKDTSRATSDRTIAVKIIQAALRALSSIFEWGTVTLIAEDERGFFHKLFLMMREQPFRVLAAECVVSVLSRRDAVRDERSLFLIKLFDRQLLQDLFAVANSRVSGPGVTEESHAFAKKCAEIFINLGTLLSNIWGKNPDHKLPDCADVYFEVLVDVINDDSLVIREAALVLFMQFLRTEYMKMSPVILNTLSNVIPAIIRRLPKVGYPFSDNHPTCKISAIDFDSDEDFSRVFQRYNSAAMSVLRMITPLAPSIAFREAVRFAKEAIDRVAENLSVSLHPKSELYAHVAAAGNVLDAVCEKLSQSQQLEVHQADGFSLLMNLMQVQPKDRFLSGYVLSCVSGAVYFAGKSVEDARLVVKYLLDLVEANGLHHKDFVKERRYLRRHSIAVITKCARVLPSAMLSMLDEILAYSARMYASDGLYSNTDKSMMKEAVLVIINNISDFDTQRKYIFEVMKPLPDQWGCLPVESPVTFFQMYGFSPAVYNDKVCFDQRCEIERFVVVVKSVLTRIQPKTDGKSSATPFIIELLPNILRLVRMILQIYGESGSAPAELSKIFELSPSEKYGLLCLGIADTSDPHAKKTANLSVKPSDEFERSLQVFLTVVFGCLCDIVGSCGGCLQEEFYSVPGLAQAILQSLLDFLDVVPEYRQKTVISRAVVGLIEHCPPAFYDHVAVPVIGRVFAKVVEPLTRRWDENMMKSEAAAGDDQNETDVLSDAITRDLTKELMDLVKVVMAGSKTERSKAGSATVGDAHQEVNGEELMNDEEGGEIRLNTSDDSKSLSDLAKAVLSTEGTAENFLLFHIRALTWPDTTSCLKATFGLTKILDLMESLFPDGNIGAELASTLFISALRGLEVNGQHDVNRDTLLLLIVRIYGLCRKAYPSMLEILKQIPQADGGKLLEQFDVAFENKNTPVPKIEKKKRDLLRSIVQLIIGKHSGQLHRREVHMKSLPSLGLQSKRPRPPPPVLDSSEDAGLVGLFGND